MLRRLAAAESLTDAVAQTLYDLDPVENIPAARFVRALHYTSFVEPRNSEWHFSPHVRSELNRRAAEAPDDLVQAAHRALLNVGLTGDPAKARTELPSYLFTDGGQAFHHAALGDTQAALDLYAKAGRQTLSGAQWLAGRLAEEQVRAGTVPPESNEILFLQAMLLYRQKRRPEAAALFEKLVATEAHSMEVRIAAHLLATFIEAQDQDRAEALYRQSLDIAEEIEDRTGVLMVKHSLGRFLAMVRTPRDLVEAEELLRGSLRLELEESRNPHHKGQTLHTLAALLAQLPQREAEAETAYNESVAIGRQTDDLPHVAQVLGGYALFLSDKPGREADAEKAFLEALAIDRELGNRFFEAQTLNSLAILISKTDPERFQEAEGYFRQSLAIGRQIRNARHTSHALRALAQHIEDRSPEEAHQLLQEGVRENENAGDKKGASILRRALQLFLKRRPLA